MSKSTHANIFLLLLGLTLFVGYVFLRPYLASVLLGGVFAVVFYPLYGLLLRFVRFRALGAALTLLLVVCVVFVPLFLVTKKIAEESAGVYSFMTTNGNATRFAEEGIALVSKYIPGIESQVQAAQVHTYIKGIFLKVVENIGPLFSKTAEIILYVILTLFTLYYLLKDGAKFREKIMEFSPLKKSEDEKIFEKVKGTVTSIVRGSLVVGVIQGIMTGLGFLIFGVPNPALWGSVAIFAAIIPGVGTALVNIPAVLFLAISGSGTNAFLLLLWSMSAVGLIDNFLRPYLIGRDAKLHPFLVLLSVLGGIHVFGPVGFLVGPLFLSFLLALLEIYPTIVLKNNK